MCLKVLSSENDIAEFFYNVKMYIQKFFYQKSYG